ncbi:hypothetical protein HMI55_002975 [Coelomomyces lativittatus]|nr:hypothetical protein HMI55_002975 [Coelomomyces lativittatus]KAJ1509320.1 hypothetical protein HMI56_006863 [Coelomomyces lativittatus]
MSRYHRLAQIRPDKVVGANLQRRLNFPDFFPPRVKDKDKLKRWNIFEGDKVMLISGKEKKEQGKVIEIDRDNNWVFVAGKKLVKKHQPNPLQLETPVPYRLKESGIHVSNVALLDPMDG